MNRDNTVFQTLENTLKHKVNTVRNTLLFLLFNRYIEEWMEREAVLCHTLFSRITFLSKKHQWPLKLTQWCHAYRLYNSQNIRNKNNGEEETLYAIAAIASLLSFKYQVPVPSDLKQQYAHIQEGVASFSKPSDISIERFTLVEQDTNDPHIYVALAEESPDRQYFISDEKLPSTDRQTLKKMTVLPDVYPLVVHLMDTEINGDIVYPSGIVIQPDYLVDVTAISECFEPDGINVMKYLLRKLTPVGHSHYLLIGNVVNVFLDELIRNPNLDFKTLLSNIFKQYPLHWIRYEDEQVLSILKLLKHHFITLRKVVNTLLPDNNIIPEAVLLEPSFYSTQYGIQGRLDLFYLDEKQKSASIVELKSGSIYRPNAYGLNINHYIQTLLYDRLIYSVYPGIKRMNYILYSKADQKPLRYAPVVRDLQNKAISVRNQIMYMDRALGYPDSASALLLKLLNESSRPLKGFYAKDIQAFTDILTRCSSLDRSYYRAFVTFMAREHQVTRLGSSGHRARRGVAALWLSTKQEKIVQYEMVDRLSYASSDVTGERPVIIMKRTGDTSNTLVNFRPGDIGILYPDNAGQQSVLHNQIYKCSVLSIDDRQITLRLRSAQFLEDHLKEEPYWNLEHDSLDSNVNQTIRGLFRFLSAPREKKNLIYGIQSPREPTTEAFFQKPSDAISLHPSQSDILSKMIATKDYFLLWGPPGSGKTSIILKYFVKHLIDQTQERILLLAYTNRAVDEMCQAIESLGGDYSKTYIRLGSRYASGAQFSDHLLQNATKKLHRRQEILDFLSEQRVFISTLASLNNNDILFDTFRFDTVVVDEAGQILESALSPVLTRFRRFILIGDHRQLPAVVTQSKEQLKVKSSLLNDIGLHQLDKSLFERLFDLARTHHWTHAYGMLEYQGRMHQDIVRFVAKRFYENRLFPLPDVKRLFAPSLYPELMRKSAQPLSTLTTQRCIFIPTPKDAKSITGKTNRYEAQIVTQVLTHLHRVKVDTGVAYTIGVITPYRAQIAQIKQLVEASDLEDRILTIDTVERYQGSARDIIILSLCTNYSHQIEFIGGITEDIINKKLNVALTRAKQQIIVLGNPSILKKDTALAAWMDYAQTLDLTEVMQEGDEFQYTT